MEISKIHIVLSNTRKPNIDIITKFLVLNLTLLKITFKKREKIIF